MSCRRNAIGSSPWRPGSVRFRARARHAELLPLRSPPCEAGRGKQRPYDRPRRLAASPSLPPSQSGGRVGARLGQPPLAAVRVDLLLRPALAGAAALGGAPGDELVEHGALPLRAEHAAEALDVLAGGGGA